MGTVLHGLMDLKPGNPQPQHRSGLVCNSRGPGPHAVPSEMTSAVRAPATSHQTRSSRVKTEQWETFSQDGTHLFLAREESSRLSAQKSLGGTWTVHKRFLLQWPEHLLDT